MHQDFAITLENILKNNKLGSKDIKITELALSAANYYFNRPEETFVIEPLQHLIDPHRRLEYATSLVFDKKEDYRSLFQLWINWLSDRKKKDVKRINLLKGAMDSLDVLSNEFYEFRLDLLDEYGATYLTFDDQFKVRFYADISSILPLKLRIYNNEQTVKDIDDPKRIILGMDSVNPKNINEELPDLAQFSDGSIRNYNLIDKEELFGLLSMNNHDYKNLSENIKMRWISILDEQSILDNMQGIANDDTLLKELDEMSTRMMNDRAWPAKIVKMFQGGKYISPEKMERGITTQFLAGLYNLTELEKIIPLSSSAEEIDNIISFRVSQGLGFKSGGLSECYVCLKTPQKKLYEYYGDLTMQTIRKMYFKEDGIEINAFFGWVGRHLMKKFVPETIFSLDEHEKMETEQKQEYFDIIDETLKILDEPMKDYDTKNVEERLKYLREKNFNFGSISHIFFECCENPLDMYIYQLIDFKTIEQCLTIYWAEKLNDVEDSKTKFFKYFYHKEDKGNNRYSMNQFIEYCHVNNIEINEENYAESLYHSKIHEAEEFLNEIKDGIQGFNTNYFRFIDNKEYQKGYYFAQKHLEEIMGNIRDIIMMPSAEIKKRYMQGEVIVTMEDEIHTDCNSGYDFCVRAEEDMRKLEQLTKEHDMIDNIEDGIKDAE